MAPEQVPPDAGWSRQTACLPEQKKFSAQNQGKTGMLFTCAVLGCGELGSGSSLRRWLEPEWKDHGHVLQEVRDQHAPFVAPWFSAKQNLFFFRVLPLGVSPVQGPDHAEEAISAQNAQNPGKQRRLGRAPLFTSVRAPGHNPNHPPAAGLPAAIRCFRPKRPSSLRQALLQNSPVPNGFQP